MRELLLLLCAVNDFEQWDVMCLPDVWREEMLI